MIKILFTILLFSLIVFPQQNSKDNKLEINKKTFADLDSFKMKAKFKKDPSLYYSGAPSEQIRVKAEISLNKLVGNLILNIKSNPNKNYVLKQFKIMLEDFNGYDSEERDRICSYCEEIMDIFKIESSDGILMEWRYGFKIQ